MSSDLESRLQSDLDQARRARDKLRVLVLSTTLADLRYREIELGEEASDDVVTQVLGKAIKKRKDAAAQMEAGGRPELAEKEL